MTRQKYFQQCLKLIEIDPNITEPIAMPYSIGCGLAGGNWSEYKDMLVKSSHKFILYRIE